MTTGQDMNARIRAIWSAVDYNPIATRETLISEILVREIGVHAGERVLDVAAGTGNTALAAARRGALVTASDLVPANLARAAGRAEVEGLEMSYEVGDVSDLPFEDGSFDVVLSTFGAMYGPDHQRTADELLRVCRAGGRLGLVSWTPDGLAGQIQASNAANLPLPPAPVGPPPSRWGTEQHCRELFGARVATLTATVRSHEFCAPSALAQAEMFREHLPPLNAIYRTLGQDERRLLLERLVGLFERFNVATDGTLVGVSDYLEVIMTVAG